MSRLNLTWRFAIAVGSAIVTGMAVAALLVWQLNTTRTSYDDMLSKREVRHQDHARVVQLTFKQVQEWRNLLLRGFKYDDFQKYEKAFKTEEAETRKLAQELLQDVSDPEARQQIEDCLTAHEKMGQGYAAAIQVFAKSNGQAFTEADAVVKGQDRAPTDALDKLAGRLQQVLEDIRKSESANVSTRITRSALIAAAAFAVIAGLVVRDPPTRREATRLARHSGNRRGTAAGSGQVSTAAQSLRRVDRTGGIARRNLRVDGGNGVDDATERRELADRGGPDDPGRRARADLERNAGGHGVVDGGHPGVEPAGGANHQDDRRDRVPDQHPGAQRGRGSGAGRGGGDGLCRRGR
jgi:hypothetical protein